MDTPVPATGSRPTGGLRCLLTDFDLKPNIARNVVWLVLERAVQVVSGVLVFAVIARHVGVDGFAHLQYTQALVLLAASLALVCGAEVAVPRLVASPDKEARNQLVLHVFLIREAAAIIAYFVLLAVIRMTVDDGVTLGLAAILGLSILLREPFGVVNAWMQSRTDNDAGVVCSLAALSLKVAIVAALFIADVTSIGPYSWAFVAESALLALLLGRHYWRRMAPLRFKPDPRLVAQLLRNGTVFWLGFVLMMGARRIDQLLLKPQVSLSELGSYAACMQIIENFALLAAILANTVAPGAIYACNQLSEVRTAVRRIAGRMALVGMLGGIAIAVAAPWIVQLLYGSGFTSTVRLLRWASLSSGLVFADVALTLLVIHLRKPTWLVVKWLLVLATIGVADSILIPQHGAIGAVAGYVLGCAVAVLWGLATLYLSERLLPREVPA